MLPNASNETVVVGGLFVGMPIKAVGIVANEIVPSAEITYRPGKVLATFNGKTSCIAESEDGDNVSALVVPTFILSRCVPYNEKLSLKDISNSLGASEFVPVNAEMDFKNDVDNAIGEDRKEALRDVGLDYDKIFGDTRIAQRFFKAESKNASLTFPGNITAFGLHAVKTVDGCEISPKDVPFDSLKLRGMSLYELRRFLRIAGMATDVDADIWANGLKRSLFLSGLEEGLKKSASKTINEKRRKWMAEWKREHPQKLQTLRIEKKEIQK